MTAESMGGKLQGALSGIEASRLETLFPERGNQELSGKKQPIRNAQLSRLANAPDDTTAALGLNSGFKIMLR
jgi:hypothetical protein